MNSKDREKKILPVQVESEALATGQFAEVRQWTSHPLVEVRVLPADVPPHLHRKLERRAHLEQCELGPVEVQRGAVGRWTSVKVELPERIEIPALLFDHEQ